MWCAAQYGKHIVPIGDDRVLLSYLPGDKALEVIGVVEASRVPIHMLLEVRTHEGVLERQRCFEYGAWHSTGRQVLARELLCAMQKLLPQCGSSSLISWKSRMAACMYCLAIPRFSLP